MVSNAFGSFSPNIKLGPQGTNNGLGDDTHHTAIPNFKTPNNFKVQSGFPASGDPEKVDLIFYDL